jgi:threonine dehydratase
MSSGPTIAAIQALRDSLRGDIVRTPLLRCAALENLVGGDMRIFGKLEFLQRTGTFKARSALAALRNLDAKQLSAGVTAVSAGNHAVATAYAARESGASSKIVMLSSANPARIAACRAYGAELVLVDDVHSAFEVAERIQSGEGRFLVHPFEGPAVATGTGTVGLEICEQHDQFDAVIVPVGGGGLIGGVSNAIKQMRPDCEIIGVEPEGADSMHRSFIADEPQSIDKVRTIADSLGAPFAMPYSFALCRHNVDQLTLVNDLALRSAMGWLFRLMKIAVEPACAASTAALLGPLRSHLAGKTVVLVFCGSNIDWKTFSQQAVFDTPAAWPGEKAI